MEQSRLAFEATAERLDLAVRAANPGVDHPPPCTFEGLVQSVYMQAIMQLGGGTPGRPAAAGRPLGRTPEHRHAHPCSRAKSARQPVRPRSTPCSSTPSSSSASASSKSPRPSPALPSSARWHPCPTRRHPGPPAPAPAPASSAKPFVVSFVVIPQESAVAPSSPVPHTDERSATRCKPN